MVIVVPICVSVSEGWRVARGQRNRGGPYLICEQRNQAEHIAMLCSPHVMHSKLVHNLTLTTNQITKSKQSLANVRSIRNSQWKMNAFHSEFHTPTFISHLGQVSILKTSYWIQLDIKRWLVLPACLYLSLD